MNQTADQNNLVSADVLLGNPRDPINYGFDTGKILRLFSIPISELPEMLDRMGLPVPALTTVRNWSSRGRLNAQWLAVLLYALHRRGIRVDINSIITRPKDI